MSGKRNMVMEVKEKWTHRGPHVDEALADVLGVNYGDERFPGISIAPMNYCKSIDYTREPEEFEREKILLYGIGGGRLDEHRYDGLPGRPGCCASLAAEEFGIKDWPQLIEALNYVTDNDTKGKGKQFDAADSLRAIHGVYPTDSSVGMNWMRRGFVGHIKRMRVSLNNEERIDDKIEELSSPKAIVAGWMERTFGKQLTIKDDPALKYILTFSQQKANPEKPFLFGLGAMARNLYYEHPSDYQIPENWIDLALNSKHEKQTQFITTTKKEFNNNTVIEKVKVSGRELKIAIITSNDDLVAKYARSREGDSEIALVIQIKPLDKAAGDGFIQIHPNAKFRLSLDGITLAIRTAEQIAQGTQNPITDNKLLMAEGTLRKAPQWYRHFDLGVYNGALSLTTKPSKIEDQILKCVIDGLQQKVYTRPVSVAFNGSFPSRTPKIDPYLESQIDALLTSI